MRMFYSGSSMEIILNLVVYSRYLGILMFAAVYVFNVNTRMCTIKNRRLLLHRHESPALMI